MKKQLKLTKVPGISDKRMRGIMDEILDSLTKALSDSYYGHGNYHAEGTVLRVDELGVPTEVRPELVTSSVSADDVDAVAGLPYHLNGVSQKKLPGVLREIYRSVSKAMRGHTYETVVKIGYRAWAGETYKVGDKIESSGDMYERGHRPGDVVVEVPVTIKISGVRKDSDDSLHITAEMAMKKAA